MVTKVNVLTGATGLLGSHLAEQLVARGERVRALVRPTSDYDFLLARGIELSFGDLNDLDSLRRTVAGADIVYHCAARVGDWGPWRDFQRDIIDATSNLLEACRRARVGRVLHVSSLSVHGHPKVVTEHFTEDEPLGQNLWVWDYYCRAKIRAEELCRAYPGELTIVRPSWIFGPRDRTTLPRVLRALEAGRVVQIGPGDNLLNIVYAADVAEGAILAANHPGAVGRAYNLSSAGEITQREFLDLLTKELGKPRVTRRVPYRLAFWSALVAETFARAIHARRPPHFTRYAVALIGRSTRYSIERARNELGWQPRVSVPEGVRRTLAWHNLMGKGRV